MSGATLASLSTSYCDVIATQVLADSQIKKDLYTCSTNSNSKKISTPKLFCYRQYRLLQSGLVTNLTTPVICCGAACIFTMAPKTIMKLPSTY